MDHQALEDIINQKLASETFKDYTVNGLQIEGKREVKRIVTGVTACQALIDKAIAKKADALLVHHGYFWKNEGEALRGMKYQRIKSLITHDINLYAYHLPLDAHYELGNNAQLGLRLGFKNITPMGENYPYSLIFTGELESPLTGEEMAIKIEKLLKRSPLHIGDNAKANITKMAWCSGAAQDFLEEIAMSNRVDAYMTGEVSERTTHIARELGIHFYAAGHHATERFGVKVLGEWLAETHGLEVEFIDIDNPV